VYNDPSKISGDLSHNPHVLLFLCLPACLSVFMSLFPVMKGKSELKIIVAAISLSVPSHNTTALNGDVQRDEVFFALHLFRCFRTKSRKAFIIFVMLVRPSFRMYQRSSHWKDFLEI